MLRLHFAMDARSYATERAHTLAQRCNASVVVCLQALEVNPRVFL